MSEYDVNEEFAAVTAGGGTYVGRLSETGVFLHTTSRPELGDLIDVRFTVIVDDPVIIKARGRVTKHSDEPSGIQVEFVDLDPMMHLRLLDAVSRRRAVEG
jgi:hypothetical protein